MNLKFTRGLLLLTALIGCFAFAKAQNILFQENFDSATPPALPGGITAIDNDGLTPYDQDANITAIGTAGWASFDDNGNIGAAAHSWYNPPGTSDDWMILPSVTLGNNSFLSWDGRSLGNTNFLEEYDIMISTTTPDISEFLLNPPLLSIVNEPNSATNHQVSLAAYAGQTVYIAFVDISTDQYIVVVDNIQIYEPTSDDAAITAFLSPVSNGCALTNAENITATVKNVGANDIALFNISYSINGGAAVTEVIGGPITPGNSLDYTFSSPVDLSAPNAYQIQVYLSGVSGDANPANDTTMGSATSAAPHDFTANALSMGFESTENFGAWRIGEDLNGNNQSWNRNAGTLANNGTGYVSIVANTIGSNNDDWFFTPCLNLQNGETYVVNFSVITTGTSTRKMKIMYGNGQNAASMSQTIADEPALSTSGLYSGLSYQFTATADGVFYIGFQDYSDVDPNFPSLAIDDILIYKKSPLDASTVGFAAPQTGTCALSTTEQIQVGIFNAGTTSISNFNVSYTVNGGAAVTETVTSTIDPDSLLIYTFTATADLSAPADYIIMSYTSLGGDGAAWNDTSTTTVTSIPMNSVPPAFTLGFEQGESLAGWTLGDVNQDGTSWFVDNTNAFSGQQSITYDSDPANTADDWLFSSCFNFQTGTTYELSFYLQVDTSNLHDMEVAIGGTASAAGMTQTFMNLNSVSDNPYALKSGTFTVATTGTYYLGFHVFSAPNLSYISMDDVKVDIYNAINEKDALDAYFHVYPNPSNGKFVLTNNLVKKDNAIVRVTNSLGQVVSNNTITRNSEVIDLSNQPAGVYLMKITTSEGTATKRVVVTK